MLTKIFSPYYFHPIIFTGVLRQPDFFAILATMLRKLSFNNNYSLSARYLYTRFLYVCFIYISGILFLNSSVAAMSQSLKIHSNLEIDFNYQTSKDNKGDTLLLIIPSEYGLQPAEQALLNILPDFNIEVWSSNLLESYFLPNSASNLEKIPAQDIQQILKKLHQKTNKKLIILTSGRGAIPVLRALASWPDKVSPSYLSGLILMHPKLFTKTPEPGLAAEVMPSVKNTNQLIYLIQPQQSPFWWNRNIAIEGLQQSGSDVFIRPLKDIRNRYYFRPDATKEEQRLTTKYPHLIYNAISQLKRYPVKARAVTTGFKANTNVTSVKSSRKLAPYKGSPIPPELKLEVFKKPNHLYNMQKDKGKVLLVNFWASWCPPCVHEMPSMQALDNKLNKTYSGKFKILAINMAEDSNTINTFLKTKVSVDFNILLDTNGAALKQWKIFAFPTSFIIDKKGNIRYAIYGGIDWLDTDVVNKIKQLINE